MKTLLLIIGTIYIGFSQNVNTKLIDSLLSRASYQKVFNGNILISKNGKIIFEKSYGLQNIESNTKHSKKSQFQIASISKQFTAFGILLLQQEDKLNINDSVAHYLPNFPYKEITLRHLLTHTSGLPNFTQTIWKDLDTLKINGNDEMLDLLYSNKYPLQWKPGDKWEYSDIGYCTLASIIEIVSKQSFEVFMKKNLFQPAGLTNSIAEAFTDARLLKHKNLSVGYISDTSTHSIDIAYDLTKYNFIGWLGGFYGDGSIVSTARDLAKWSHFLDSGDLITKNSLSLATTPAVLNNGELAYAWDANYGLGWHLYNSDWGPIQTHSGGHPGYTSVLVRCPKEKLTIVLLSNFSIEKVWELNLLENTLKE